jgi:hypothetical protein
MSEITTANRRPPVATVREWTIALGILTSGNMTRADAEMKLRAYVPLLQDNFPAAAFTQASLHHVAAQCKWFPSYGEVVEHLRAWWNPRRPLPPALPPPERVPVHAAVATPEEREYVRALVEGVAARIRATDDDTVAGAQAFGAAYLSPGVLDAINPLPNGRKRSEAAS